MKELDNKSQAILNALYHMIRLAGKIELFELIFPIIRQELDAFYRKGLQELIDDFLNENFVL